MKTSSKLLSAGFISAISASLCCITPILALVAGTSGLASAFAWMEPLRPYLIAFSLLVLGVAWYQNLRSTKQRDRACGCESAPDRKRKFMESKSWLGLVTVFSILMLGFPYYATLLYPKSNIVKQQTIRSAATSEFTISGMSCRACEDHVSQVLAGQKGILRSDVSFEQSHVVVVFDSTQTSVAEIQAAINSTGYSASIIGGK